MVRKQVKNNTPSRTSSPASKRQERHDAAGDSPQRPRRHRRVPRPLFARNPEKRALTIGERSWTYVELDAAANRAANALLALGLRKGDRVAACGRNSDAYVMLWLAWVGERHPLRLIRLVA